MKCCLISDTHNKHESIKIPKCDVLIHAGDMTNMGTIVELNLVAKWMKELLTKKIVKNIVITPGNHDFLFEQDEIIARHLFNDEHIHVLINELIIINGFKFYGAPQTIEFYNWAFNIPKDKMNIYWDNIPPDTDILITHQPPYEIGDQVNCEGNNLGCKFLKEKIIEIQPRLHVWGHIHGGRGIYTCGRTQMINAANLDERYQIQGQPFLIEI